MNPLSLSKGANEVSSSLLPQLLPSSAPSFARPDPRPSHPPHHPSSRGVVKRVLTSDSSMHNCSILQLDRHSLVSELHQESAVERGEVKGTREGWERKADREDGEKEGWRATRGGESSMNEGRREQGQGRKDGQLSPRSKGREEGGMGSLSSPIQPPFLEVHLQYTAGV